MIGLLQTEQRGAKLLIKKKEISNYNQNNFMIKSIHTYENNQYNEPDWKHQP